MSYKLSFYDITGCIGTTPEGELKNKTAVLGKLREMRRTSARGALIIAFNDTIAGMAVKRGTGWAVEWFFHAHSRGQR